VRCLASSGDKGWNLARHLSAGRDLRRTEPCLSRSIKAGGISAGNSPR
jgi:hypothetical protein